MGIAEVHTCWSADNSGVEIGDTRAGDAGAVAKLQRLAVVDLVFHAGLWHPVVEVLAKVI